MSRRGEVPALRILFPYQDLDQCAACYSNKHLGEFERSAAVRSGIARHACWEYRADRDERLLCATFGRALAEERIRRGREDRHLGLFLASQKLIVLEGAYSMVVPSEKTTIEHRALLLAEDSEHYGKFFSGQLPR